MIYKRKKTFNWRKIWQLRYRAYAVLIVFILGPILYSSNSDVSPNIDFSIDQYEITESNLIAAKLAKLPAFANTTNSDENGNYIIQDGKKVYIDKTGDALTELLKEAGFDNGYISAEPFIDLKLGLPIEQKIEEVESTDVVVDPNKPKTLDDIIPRPSTAQFRNFLRYPKYNINAPIIYSSFEDLFNKNPDGTINTFDPIDNNPIDSPVQQKLKDGIVHIAYSPQPGEIGNSYIIGHSSNFSVVKSNYNTIFKPLESKSQPGEEFIIYDRFGRELKFRVFEAYKISGEDGNEAYKKFEDRRVVTLQTSIVTWTNKGWAATHRWLTRGELVVE
jgi:hypothetical protein